MNNALKDLLFRMADDLLVIGHRSSEWTGLGPILEEDIAFSSMAQDKLGHAQALYAILHENGEAAPDTLAFGREAKEFKNAQFTELPIGDYAFSLMRHFLYDYADQIRFQLLSQSSYTPLAMVAVKIKGELKYHSLHAKTWISRLSKGSEEGRARMQSALDEAWDYALGMFEPGIDEQALISENIFPGEARLMELWYDAVSAELLAAGLKIKDRSGWAPVNGGRKGYHTEHLEALITEMGEVFRIDPSAEW